MRGLRDDRVVFDWHGRGAVQRSRSVRQPGRSQWVHALAAAALVLHASPARAAGLERTREFAARFGEAAFDLMILRPLSGAALAAGSIFFVASAPLSAPEGWIRTGSFVEGVRPAWSTFVYAPYEYTILREIGDF